MSKNTIVVALAALLAMVTVVHADIVIIDPATRNGSFETTTGWNGITGVLDASATHGSYIGSYTSSAVTTSTATKAFANQGLHSSFDMALPLKFVLTFDMKCSDSSVISNPPSFTLVGEYNKNAGGSAKSSPRNTLSSASLTSAFQTFTMEFELTPVDFKNWATSKLEIELKTRGQADFGFDNFVLKQIPEPATMGLLGLGAVMMFRRRAV